MTLSTRASVIPLVFMATVVQSQIFFIVIRYSISRTITSAKGQAVLPPVPKHIKVLVTSSDCEVEAISVDGKPYILGLQFDSHAASTVDAWKWLEGDREWLSQPPGVDAEAILKDVQTHEALMGEQFEVFFSNYVRLIL